MPAKASRKRGVPQDTYEEDDFIENDDGRAAKKSKTSKGTASTRGGEVKNGVQKDDDGLEFWEVCLSLGSS